MSVKIAAENRTKRPARVKARGRPREDRGPQERAPETTRNADVRAVEAYVAEGLLAKAVARVRGGLQMAWDSGLPLVAAGSAQPVVKALDELIARSSEPGEVATESIPRPTRQAAVDLPLASGPQSRRHLLTGIALGAGAVVLLAALFAF